MPSIPINPSDIANAKLYTSTFAALNFFTCEPPKLDGGAPEVAKMVAMQFTFAATAVWNVNLKQGAPQPPLSQIACMFVDATQSGHDVNIYFPDSGYTRRVKGGNAQLIPVLSGLKIPPFFVILDSSGAVDADDIVNVIALNRFIPESATDNFVNSIAYGYSQYFELQPTFTQSTTFSDSITPVSNPDPSIPFTLINHTQWYMTGLQISGCFESATDYNRLSLVLIDGTNTQSFMASTILTGAMGVPLYIPLFNLSGLNILSSGTGPLKAKVVPQSGYAALSDFQIDFNIMGGILVN